MIIYLNDQEKQNPTLAMLDKRKNLMVQYDVTYEANRPIIDLRLIPLDEYITSYDELFIDCI